MPKYSFQVEAVISLHFDVEAASLEEALREAQGASVISLCPRCAGGSKGEWATSGELDADPACSPLASLLVDGEDDPDAWDEALKEWDQ